MTTTVSPLFRLEIPSLWRELTAVRFQIDQRRLVEAIEAAHQNRVALDADQLDDRGAQRIRPLWRAQRKGAARRFVVLRTLQHQIAARQMQPIDHFEVGVEVDPLQRRHPWLENLEPAHRAIMTPLPWCLETRGPGRADAAVELQPGVARAGQLHVQLP